MAAHVVGFRYTDGLEWISFLLFHSLSWQLTCAWKKKKKGGIEIELLSNKVVLCYLVVRKPRGDWGASLVMSQFFTSSTLLSRSQLLSKVLAKTEVFCLCVEQTPHRCSVLVFKGAGFCFIFLGICPSSFSF